MFTGEKRFASFLIIFMLIMLSVLAGFGGAFLYMNSQPASSGETISLGANPSENLSQNILLAQKYSEDLGLIPKIYEDVSESVVEITTESVEWGGFMGQYISSGAGSGVVYTADGYLITNNHVIDGANKITVSLKNGDKYEAKLIAKDSRSDIALLKIEASSLKPIIFGDSDKIITGQLAVAMGNPLGELGGTITEGIISALDREIVIENETMTLLQTTAAINPGNSGGGLFDAQGQLIGLVNAKTSGSNIEGLGFAIPSNIVKEVVEQLMDYGHVKGRAGLGIGVREISDMRTAEIYRLPGTGLYVEEVNEGRYFRAGDKIISFEGQAINKISDLRKALDQFEVGQVVELVVQREGQILTLKIKLIELLY